MYSTKHVTMKGERFQMDKIVLAEIKDLSKLSGKDIDRRARATAEALVKGDRLKTHQLRNIYATIDRMRTIYQRDKDFTQELEDRLYLLKPQLAYAAGRQKSVNSTLFPFMERLIAGIEGAEKAEDRRIALRNFFALIESVVGYHKYFENVKNAQ